MDDEISVTLHNGRTTADTWHIVRWGGLTLAVDVPCSVAEEHQHQNLHADGTSSITASECPPEVSRAVVCSERIDVVLVSHHEHIPALSLFLENPFFHGEVVMTEPSLAYGQMDLRAQHAATKRHISENQDTKQATAAFTIDRSQVRLVAYNEKVRLATGLILEPRPSSYSIGACNWVLRSDELSLGIIAESCRSENRSVKKMDHRIFSECDVLLCHKFAPTGQPVKEQSQAFAAHLDGTLRRGGIALVPVRSNGLIFDLLDIAISVQAHVGSHYPIYFLGDQAKPAIAFANVLSPWLNEKEQRRTQHGDWPFIHPKLQGGNRLICLKDTLSPEFTKEFKAPCIVFADDARLSRGPSVAIANYIKRSSKNMILLAEHGISYKAALTALQPLHCRVEACYIDRRLTAVKDLHALVNQSSKTQLIITSGPSSTGPPPTSAKYNVVHLHPSQPLRITIPQRSVIKGTTASKELLKAGQRFLASLSAEDYRCRLEPVLEPSLEGASHGLRRTSGTISPPESGEVSRSAPARLPVNRAEGGGERGRKEDDEHLLSVKSEQSREESRGIKGILRHGDTFEGFDDDTDDDDDDLPHSSEEEDGDGDTLNKGFLRDAGRVRMPSLQHAIPPVSLLLKAFNMAGYFSPSVSPLIPAAPRRKASRRKDKEGAKQCPSAHDARVGHGRGQGQNSGKMGPPGFRDYKVVCYPLGCTLSVCATGVSFKLHDVDAEATMGQTQGKPEGPVRMEPDHRASPGGKASSNEGAIPSGPEQRVSGKRRAEEVAVNAIDDGDDGDDGGHSLGGDSKAELEEAGSRKRAKMMVGAEKQEAKQEEDVLDAHDANVDGGDHVDVGVREEGSPVVKREPACSKAESDGGSNSSSNSNSDESGDSDVSSDDDSDDSDGNSDDESSALPVRDGDRMRILMRVWSIAQHLASRSHAPPLLLS